MNQIVQQLQKVGSDFEFQSVGYWNSKNGTIVIHNSPPLQWTRTTGKIDKMMIKMIGTKYHLISLLSKQSPNQYVANSAEKDKKQ